MDSNKLAKSGFIRRGDRRPGELRPSTNYRPSFGLFHRETAVSPGPSEIRGESAKKPRFSGRR